MIQWLLDLTGGATPHERSLWVTSHNHTFQARERFKYPAQLLCEQKQNKSRHFNEWLLPREYIMIHLDHYLATDA